MSIMNLHEDIENKSKQVTTFLPLLSLYRSKLKKKKALSKEVISTKMKELHYMIDKWEQRFLDTAEETIDEKIEMLAKQERVLKGLNSKMGSLLKNYQGKLNSGHIVTAYIDHNEEDLDASLSRSLDGEDDDQLNQEVEGVLESLKKVEFPLHPPKSAVDLEKGELDVDVRIELGELMDEAEKSLKRTLSNIGGIVRGYLRKGQNNAKWIKQIRMLEARPTSEVDQKSNENQNVEVGVDATVPVESAMFEKQTRIWKAVSDLYKYRADQSLRAELCNELSEFIGKDPSEVEFYLPQLLVTTLHEKKEEKDLENFTLNICSGSQHFALLSYFILASITTGSNKWAKKCHKFMKKIEVILPVESEIGKRSHNQFQALVNAIAETEKTNLSSSTNNISRKKEESNGDTHNPSFSSKNVRREGKEYFFSQVSFLKALVNISEYLTSQFSNPQSLPSLLRQELGSLERFFIEGSSIIPGINAAKKNRVVKIHYDSCYHIPTYGRVLFYLLVELIELPLIWSREKATKFIDHALKICEAQKMSSPVPQLDDIEPDELRELESTPAKKAVERPVAVSSFGVPFKKMQAFMKEESLYGRMKGWRLASYIVKNGENMFQEQFVMQLIRQFDKIFQEEKTGLRLRPYEILSISSDSGIIEVIPNALSIDKLKQISKQSTLLQFYRSEWPEKNDFENARRNFVCSLAAYSLVCYFLQITDRHNGNIMIESSGYLVHIDFGNVLASAVKFEKAPWKLTEEFVELMGGDKSKMFKNYVDLIVQGLLAVRKHYERILLLVEMTMTTSAMEGQFLPCLEKGNLLKNLRKRFKLEWNDEQIREFVMNLVCAAKDNWRTTIYDTYQRILNDIQM